MKSFQAICLQFCVTLSAPFLTCHKNVAHSHTHTNTGKLWLYPHYKRSLGATLQHQTQPGCQFRSELATRQGVTLINGVALLTPTSLSVWLPFKTPFLPFSLFCPTPFYVYFWAKLFRVPISRKISFKCNKMQCRCHKSIPLDCRRRRTSQRHKIEMHWHWKINNKRKKKSGKSCTKSVSIWHWHFYNMQNSVSSLMRKLNIFEKSEQSNKKQQAKKKKAGETPRNNFKTFSLTAVPTRQRYNRQTHTYIHAHTHIQNVHMDVPVCSWKYATHTASASQTSLARVFHKSFSLRNLLASL